MRDSSTDRDYELWVLLHQTKDAIYKARDKELRRLGITSPMVAAVLFIVEAIEGPATPAEISRWLFRENHSTSGLLIRMEKEGLINKTKDLDRKNLIRVSLTEKGQQALKASMERESIHRIFSSLSEEQRSQLASCLDMLRTKALGELWMQAPPFPPSR